MKSRKGNSTTWTEAEFEGWFLRNQEIPTADGSSEPVLVISHQRPIRHMVDIVAIDRDGGLVFIEVKNEQSTRSAVGQALEYLADYDGASIEDLAEDFVEAGDRTLQEAFRDQFKKELKQVSPRRRVFIAAPSFDHHTDLCMQFLSRALKERSAEFALLTVNRATGRSSAFELKGCPPVQLTAAKDLKGFVHSPRGRIYYVLEPGPKPLLWAVGRQGADGGLKFARQPSLKVRAKRAIALEQAPADVDIAECGSTWQKNEEPNKQARLVGFVGTGSSRQAVLARFEDGRYQGVRCKLEKELRRQWKKTEVRGLPGWRTVAALMAKSRRSGAVA